MMVVLARSYSRQSGEMSLDTETGTPGSRFRSSRASARSWAGFAYEKRRLTAMATPATAPSSRRSTAAATRSSSPSVRGRSTVPSLVMRSSTPRQSRRATNGCGFSHCRSYGSFLSMRWM